MAYFFMMEVPVVTQVPMSSVETPEGHTLDSIQKSLEKAGFIEKRKVPSPASTGQGGGQEGVRKVSSYVSLADRFAPLHLEDRDEELAIDTASSNTRSTTNSERKRDVNKDTQDEGRSVSTEGSGAHDRKRHEEEEEEAALPPGMVWWPIEQYCDEFFEREDIHRLVVGRRKLLDSFTSALLFKKDARAQRLKGNYIQEAEEKMDCHVVYLFRVFNSYNVEYIIQELAAEIGVGSDAYPQCGTVTVVPAEISRPSPHIIARYKEIRRKYIADMESNEGLPAHLESKAINEAMKKGMKDSHNSFTKTIGSRILVDKLMAQINSSSAFSFDFLMLAVAASLLAGIGLGIDNAVVIVASMLVSPLMGPILGMTFGTFIFDWPLVKRALLTETLGLLICVLGGLVIGLTFGNLGNLLKWPTLQMSDRGDAQALWIGITIAVPSGVGVAISVLGENTASLVGVAISAALLPPLVNSGQLLAFAALSYATLDIDSGYSTEELVIMSGYSFALTMINILCIFVMALLMFKFKEATPFRGKSILFSTVTRQLRRRAMQNEEINQPQDSPEAETGNEEHIGLERARDLFYALQSGEDVIATDKSSNTASNATLGRVGKHSKAKPHNDRHYHTVDARGRLRVSQENVEQTRPASTVVQDEVPSRYFADNQSLHHLTFHPRRHRRRSLPSQVGVENSSSGRKFDLTSFAKNTSLI